MLGTSAKTVRAAHTGALWRIASARMPTTNPRKASALTENGVELVAMLSCEAAPNPHSVTYLRTKKERMGHALSLDMAKARTEEEVCVRCDLVGWRTTCPVCVPGSQLERIEMRSNGVENVAA